MLTRLMESPCPWMASMGLATSRVQNIKKSLFVYLIPFNSLPVPSFHAIEPPHPCDGLLGVVTRPRCLLSLRPPRARHLLPTISGSDCLYPWSPGRRCAWPSTALPPTRVRSLPPTPMDFDFVYAGSLDRHRPRPEVVSSPHRSLFLPRARAEFHCCYPLSSGRHHL